ncbi:MAG: glyoxylase-like metal-dependent hydrolase (beta-lactamase superfamily II) [Candidatus Poriferisodalaceae bacterium]|jgi:glyoxylase-like metal-dependent hydrolase (beta-lactamase superfamily II)
MTSLATYSVYAFKYAERVARRPEHFIGGDPHDVPMPMDYFVWAVVPDDGSETWVIDTGFAAVDAEQRRRTIVCPVNEALATMGIDSSQAANVVLTHLHYDHLGGWEHFPTATFHVQDTEMAYATGRDMTRSEVNHAYTARHVSELVLEVFAGRVSFHDGDDELMPGLTVHLVGGHTKGMQVVRVHTKQGWMVLASDASHFYENMQTRRHFPIHEDADQMASGWDRLLELADDPDWIVPGHDPLVLERYPAPRPELQGLVADLTPPA